MVTTFQDLQKIRAQQQQVIEQKERFEKERKQALQEAARFERGTAERTRFENQFREAEQQIRRFSRANKRLQEKKLIIQRKLGFGAPAKRTPPPPKKVIVAKKPVKEFIIKDVKTGKVIERRKAGETISEVRARAKAQLLGTVPTQRQKEIKVKQAFIDAQLEGLTKILSSNQQKQVLLQVTAKTPIAQDRLIKKLKDIDAQKNLTVFQKEEEKRKLLGISPARVRELPTLSSPQAQDLLRQKKRADLLVIAQKQLKVELGKSKQALSGIKAKAVPYSVYKGLFNVAGALVRVVINPRDKKKVNIITDNIAAEGLKLSFNYGRNLRKRFDKDENNPLMKDINKFTKSSGKLLNFVKKHPEESAVITALATTKGLTFGISRFNKDPVATTTEAALILAPNKVLKGAKKFLDEVDNRIITRAFDTSVDATRRANSDILKAFPKWDIQFDKAKLIKELKKKAAEEKRKLDALKRKDQTAKTKSQSNYSNKRVRAIKSAARRLKIEKVIGEIVEGKEKLRVESVFEKAKQPKKLASNELPGTEQKLISFIEETKGLISMPVALQLMRRAQKISPRFRITSTQTRNKGIFKLTFDKPTKVKMPKTKLPTDKDSLVKLLERARAESGEAFSKLKKRIKKELGLNVKVFSKKTGRKIIDIRTGKLKDEVKIQIKVLESKELKVKARKTKKDKRVKIDVELLNPKQVSKQAKEIEFLLEQGRVSEVSSKATKSLASKLGKKGSARISSAANKGANNWFNKSNKDISSASKKVKETGQGYKGRVSKAKKEVSNKKDTFTNEINRQGKRVDRNKSAVKSFFDRLKAKAPKADTPKKKAEVKSIENNLDDVIKSTNKETQKYNGLVKSRNEELLKTQKKLNNELNKIKAKYKQEVANLNKQKSMIEQQLKSIQKLDNKLKSLGIIKTSLISAGRIKLLITAIKKLDSIIRSALIDLETPLPSQDLKFRQMPPIQSPRAPPKAPPRAPPRVPRKPPMAPPRVPRKPPMAPPRVPRKPPMAPPRVPRKPPKKPTLDFNTPLPRGTRLKFDALFRERKNSNKPAGKNNPVIVKRLKLGLPKNKALERIFSSVDQATQRSAQLVIAGTTKVKDIKKPKLKGKFNIRKTKTSLIFVEKAKHAIDSVGEKKGLALSKLFKKRRKPMKKKR